MACTAAQLLVGNPHYTSGILLLSTTATWVSLTMLIATDFLGYTAAACTTVAFIPQALKVLRERDTRSLSLSMYIIFNVGVYLWAVYGFVKHDGALIGANVCTAILSTAILLAKLRNVLNNHEPK